MRFKVIQGKHWMNRRAYSSGSVVETDIRLDRAFPGRFEKLPEETPVPQDPTPITVDTPPEPVVTEPETESVESPVTVPETKRIPKRKVVSRRKN